MTITREQLVEMGADELRMDRRGSTSPFRAPAVADAALVVDRLKVAEMVEALEVINIIAKSNTHIPPGPDMCRDLELIGEKARRILASLEGNDQ